MLTVFPAPWGVHPVDKSRRLTDLVKLNYEFRIQPKRGMDHFLEGMEKEMKFLTKIRFTKCVLPKLTVFEKKMINKNFGTYR